MIALLAKFKAYIVAALSLLGLIVGIYFTGKKIGKAENEVSSANQKIKDNEALAVDEINRGRAASETETETIKAAKDASDEVLSTNINDVANELRNEWTRTDDDSRSGGN